ncbi:MAG: hypothetical protein K6E91_06555 [Butyrivibrio sp.]|nr:hypothetical protein [Butyrivibrio sp.]
MAEWIPIIVICIVFGFLIRTLGRAIMNIGISIAVIILVIVILNGLMVIEW